MSSNASANAKTTKISATLENLSQREINEDLWFGIDVGIASCGWAVVDAKKQKIIKMGSRCFDRPESFTNRRYKSHKADRGEKRRARRTIGRKRRRMVAVRNLLQDYGVPVPMSKTEVARANPWKARALAVIEKVPDKSVAVALHHIAKFRGAKFNSKSDGGSDTQNKKERTEYLKAIEKNDRVLNGRTVGQYLFEEHETGRKHNRKGNFTHLWRRERLQEEAERIIDKQFELGCEWADADFKRRYCEIAFNQRPLKSSFDLVGTCPHEPTLKRAPAVSYSFELFRLLSKLNNECRIVDPRSGESRSLGMEELELITENFGKHQKVTLATLKRYVRPPQGYLLTMLDTEPGRDVTGAQKGASFGSNTLYKILGADNWDALVEMPWKLDAISKIITFNDDFDDIQRRLKRLPIDPSVADRLMAGLRDRQFDEFAGTGNVSLRAARNLLRSLKLGKTYDQACQAAGYAHSTSPYARIEDIPSAVVQRAVHETMKQIAFLVNIHGRPGAIRIESMRDVGKSADERSRIFTRQNANRVKNEKEREHFKELVGRYPRRSAAEELRFRLLKQQLCVCAYCGKSISARHDIAESNTQLDHVWPKSKVGELWGEGNLVLTHVGCNQNKLNKTPWEWMGHDDIWWSEFKARVATFGCTKDKKNA